MRGRCEELTLEVTNTYVHEFAVHLMAGIRLDSDDSLAAVLKTGTTSLCSKQNSPDSMRHDDMSMEA